MPPSKQESQQELLERSELFATDKDAALAILTRGQDRVWYLRAWKRPDIIVLCYIPENWPSLECGEANAQEALADAKKLVGEEGWEISHDRGWLNPQPEPEPVPFESRRDYLKNLYKALDEICASVEQDEDFDVAAALHRLADVMQTGRPTRPGETIAREHDGSLLARGSAEYVVSLLAALGREQVATCLEPEPQPTRVEPEEFEIKQEDEAPPIVLGVSSESGDTVPSPGLNSEGRRVKGRGYLVLTRGTGDSVTVLDPRGGVILRVVLNRIENGRCRLAFRAQKRFRIYRSELLAGPLSKEVEATRGNVSQFAASEGTAGRQSSLEEEVDATDHEASRTRTRAVLERRK